MFPKHYSLHSENDSHFVIHDKRDGKTFKVAKKPLHPAHQLNILKMQKFDEGGDVQDIGGVENIVQGQQDQPQDQVPQPQPQAQAAPQSANAVEIPQGQLQVGGQEVPGKTPDTLGQFTDNQKLEEEGLKTKGGALAKEGELNAQAYADANKKIGDFYTTSSAAIDNLGKENDALAASIADPKSNIDPKAYFHNMGTGQKIANAIALVVGGIGAGLTHGPNMAMEMINKAIERDIESQKINLGKKQSLLSINLARYKDMKAAQSATMAQMNAMAQGEIAKNAAKYGGVAGQAGTNALLGELKNKNLQDAMGLKQQIFQLQLQQHLANGQNVSQDDPASYVRYVVPPDRQQKVFDEIDAAQNTRANAPQILQAFDSAASKLHAADFVPGMNNADQKALHALLGPTFKDVEGTVRQAAMDNMFDNTTPQFGDSKATIEKKRDALLGYMKSKSAAPTAKGFNIDLSKFNTTSMDHVQPRQVKTVNGVRYERGPNGEARRID